MHGAIGGHGGMRWAAVASLVLHAVVLGGMVEGGRRVMPGMAVLFDLEVVIVVGENAAPAVVEAPPPAVQEAAAAPVPAADVVAPEVKAVPGPVAMDEIVAVPVPVARRIAAAVVRPGPPRVAGSGAVPAPAPSSPAPSSPVPSSPVGGGADAAAVAVVWRAALLAWVQAHKEYPRAARLRGVEGIVGVRVTVAADGRVGAVVVEGSSGSELLDGAVRRMLEGAQVPPFPPGMAPGAREEALRVGFSLQ